MAIPEGVETVTLTDGGVPLAKPDGTPLEGYITVSGPDLATVPGGDFLFGGHVRRWVEAGRFSPITLVATDATGVNPSGFSYTVTLTPQYDASWTRYVVLPKASPEVVLADILIPDPVAGSYSVLVNPADLLVRAANLSDLTDPAAARGNLGLGSAALADTGVPGGVAGLGPDGRVPAEQLPAGSVGSGPYLHTQSAPASVWQVAHGLGYRPVVAVTVGDQVVLADVVHSSLNLASVTFPAPVAGTATCT